MAGILYSLITSKKGKVIHIFMIKLVCQPYQEFAHRLINIIILLILNIIDIFL